MGLKEWLQEFKSLHEQARAGALSDDERAEYVRAREELAGALLTAQRLELKQGQMARQSLRVQRTMQVDLLLMGIRVRTMTLDVSVGGFAAMLGGNPPLGEHAEVTLKLPGNQPPLEARAIVAGLHRQGAIFRVSFSFGELPQADKERLGFLVFDTVLEAMR